VDPVLKDPNASTEMTSNDTLARLAAVIESRRGGDPDQSYVARLFAKGTDAILKKVGEEATEVVMAGKDGDRQKIVCEVADLWFHSMVALAHFGLTARPTCWPNWSGARAVGPGRICAAQGRRPRKKGHDGRRHECRSHCIFCKIVAGQIPSKKATRTTSCWPSTTSTPGRRCTCWSSPSAHRDPVGRRARARGAAGPHAGPGPA
jgi:phosphoribosyl-ATP pyrophosphohydrolase